MNTTLRLVLILAYAVICVLISTRSKGDTEQTREGFFLGGRSIGLVTAVTSLIMGFLSGLAFMGCPAFAMRNGAISMVSYGWGWIGLLYPWIGYKLWKISKEQNYLTPVDYFRDRYESQRFAYVIAAIQCLLMIPYITIQLTAVGNIISFFTDMSLQVAVIIFACLVLVCFFVGGAKAVSGMDVFNAIVGVVGPLILCFIAAARHGGLVNLGSSMLESMPDYFTRLSDAGFLSNMGTFLSSYFALLFAPHILSKMMMLPSRKNFQKMAVTVPISYALILFPIVMMGWVGIAYHQDLFASNDVDNLVLHIIGENAPEILIVLMAWAILAFCMSTANSFALAIGTIISHDFYDSFHAKKGENMETEASAKKSIWVGKASAFICVLAAIVLACSGTSSITDLGYSLAGPCFAQTMPCLIFGMFWRRGSRQAAWSSVIVGFIVLFITMFVYKSPLGLAPVVWSICANTLTYMIVSTFTKPSRECYEKFFGEEDRRLAAYYSSKCTH